VKDSIVLDEKNRLKIKKIQHVLDLSLTLWHNEVTALVTCLTSVMFVNPFRDHKTELRF